MGNSKSSSGEEEIPAVLREGDAPASGSRASAAATSEKTAAGDVTEEEARGFGNRSTSPAAANNGMGGEETATSDAAKGDEEEPEAVSGEKKKRTVRTCTPAPFPTLPCGMDHFPEHIRNAVTDAISYAARVLQQSQEWVRGQMEEKGYVEHEVDVAEEWVLLRRGRRRFRPGVRVSRGSIKRVN